MQVKSGGTDIWYNAGSAEVIATVAPTSQYTSTFEGTKKDDEDGPGERVGIYRLK